jgi:hypothetical protein
VQTVQEGGADLVICEGIVWGSESSGRALPVSPRYQLNGPLNGRLKGQRVLAKSEALKSFTGLADSAEVPSVHSVSRLPR